MTEYRFKPALLRSEVSYEITEQQIRCDDWPGTKALNIDDITGIRYSSIKYRPYIVTSLELTTAGQTCAISLNRSTTTAADDPDLAAFRQTVIAAVSAIRSARPDLEVSWGSNRKQRAIIFTIGAVSFVFSVALVIVAFATGVPSQKLYNAVPAVILLALFGIILGVRFNPWKAEEKLGPEALVALLKAGVI